MIFVCSSDRQPKVWASTGNARALYVPKLNSTPRCVGNRLAIDLKIPLLTVGTGPGEAPPGTQPEHTDGQTIRRRVTGQDEDDGVTGAHLENQDNDHERKNQGNHQKDLVYKMFPSPAPNNTADHDCLLSEKDRYRVRGRQGITKMPRHIAQLRRHQRAEGEEAGVAATSSSCL
ncbi:PREDICTED: uncharacterized protein LOC109465914 [Branchiostoma belcheri]|uniref:Uncharacterized protein LOC109465914 n=1 Tax=Branchiostoma belcheri TaxID=7741 RepID=A0A6P4XQN3_BRABE|nr:PREDICTED: uncharacterized protein LOC109465914 [Branchiostoma belcheri]